MAIGDQGTKFQISIRRSIFGITLCHEIVQRRFGFILRIQKQKPPLDGKPPVCSYKHVKTEELRKPHFMQKYLILPACLLLVACNRPAENNREVLGKLDAIKSDLASARAEVRWAFANKREIDSAIFQWSRDKMEEVKKSEALPPETEQKISQYEALQSELTRKEMEGRGFVLPPRMVRPGVPAPDVSAPDESYDTLSNRVAAAKAPIAEILERRGRRAAQFRDQFSTENLIAEYAKDRFDLIVDSSDEHMSHSAVLYRTNGEVLDITDGVIKLFKEKPNRECANNIFAITLSVPLLFGCSRTLSDAEIQKLLIGTWRLDQEPAKTIQNKPDGSYILQLARVGSNVVVEGTWHVKAGFVISTMTNGP